MANNIRKEWLSHAMDLRRFPNLPINEQKQTGVNSARFARVEKAMYRLPVYLPIRWDLPAVAPLAPITASTPNKLNYDVLIVGAISDSPNREVVFKSSDLEINPSYLGKSSRIRLTLGDIAGTTKSNQGATNVAINFFTSPFILYQGQQITLDMFKETTANTEVANLVFVGLRIFSDRASFDGYLDEELAFVKKSIEAREVPRQVFLKQEVVFDASGLANDVFTPDIDEPLIIRGVRSSLVASEIREIKLRSGISWITSPCPSWAVFCEPNSWDQYLMLKEPVFLPRRSEIQVSLANTIAGTGIIDPNGSITWLCETV
jgi:hypothetical protein